LANCNEHEAEANITAPAHTQRDLHGAQGSLCYFNIHDGFPTNRHTRSCVRGGPGDVADYEVKHFVWGGSDDAPSEDDRDDTDDEVEHFVWGGLYDAPTEDDRDDADDEVEHLFRFGWFGEDNQKKSK
jgi:hypothetical protein